jgi:predicted DNA-binding protein with PD1-like motif
MELASFIGDIANEGGEPVLHAHVVLTESSAHLRKRLDRRTGLTLISPDMAHAAPTTRIWKGAQV